MLVTKKLDVIAPEGAEKVYRDALVTKGTLFLFDYSNQGTLDNYNINSGQKAYDLAREAESELELTTNEGVFQWNKAALLTDGKGLQSAGNVSGTGQQGVKYSFGGSSHLVNNQPNVLFIAWVRQKSDRPTTDQDSALFSSFPTASDVVGDSMFRVRAPQTGQSFIVDIAGGSTSSLSLTTTKGALVQLAVEFTAAGQPINVFYNGAPYATPSTGSATGFTAIDHIMMGSYNNNNLESSVAIYRGLIEDLSESGRTAADVVKADHDYVFGINDFETTPARPFVDTY